ncbi:MAG: uracil phosphoribosyltransferase [Acidimicrobiia bacterium]|nr:uracil phosphoribosyltransferase [Acidimicrobiia bacterium]
MSVTVLDHPLAEHYMATLRSGDTGPQQFRETTRRLAYLLIFEATRDLGLRDIDIETPLESTTAKQIDRDIVAVAVLRAGLGLLNAVIHVIPDVKVGYIGVARDEETVQPQEYYTKLPKLAGARVFILEPMLATGGSLAWAVQKVKDKGATDITALCVLAAPAGVEHMTSEHPDVHVVTAAVDRDLDYKFYIRPGLGDMGDRLFGTF